MKSKRFYSWKQAWTSLQQTSLQDFSYLPDFRGGMVAKDLGPRAIIGVGRYQRHRIVAYVAYIFKVVGITSAWGLFGMHPDYEFEFLEIHKKLGIHFA